MIEFKCGEASSFEFEMQITGEASGNVPEVFFCIAAPDLRLSFPAVHVENSLYAVHLPVLDKHLCMGTYPCEIQVVLGDHLFRPIQDECVLKADPKPVVSNFRPTTSTSAPGVTVSAVKLAPKVQPAVVATVAQSVPDTIDVVEPHVEGIKEEVKKPASVDLDLFSKLVKRR